MKTPLPYAIFANLRMQLLIHIHWQRDAIVMHLACVGSLGISRNSNSSISYHTAQGDKAITFYML